MTGLTIENSKDRQFSVIVSTIILLILFLLLRVITFFVNPPLPIDTPPLNSDEVIEEFMIDNVEIQRESGGSGGGTPTPDKIDAPKPQSEKFATQATSETKLFSGQSNNQNAENSQNTSSSTQRSTNPFGDGGNGGGKGGGSGSGFGNDSGSGNGSGGNGNGDGSGRKRLNNPSVDHIDTDIDVTINLKLTINSNGEVIAANNLASKTTTTDQRIINQVISAVKNQVKYSKDPDSGLVTVFLTVRVNAK
jgi:hypothetical protein